MNIEKTKILYFDKTEGNLLESNWQSINEKAGGSFKMTHFEHQHNNIVYII